MKKIKLVNLLVEQDNGTCSDLEKFSNIERGESPEQQSPLHKWNVCAAVSAKDFQGYPAGVWIPGAINFQGAFTFKGIVGGTFSNPGNPPHGVPSPADYNAFYTWAVGQVGSINVGDQITFDMGMGGMCAVGSMLEVKKLCFEYLGTGPFSTGWGWNGTSATAILNDCCDFQNTDEGCTDPAAVNFGVCCNGNPNCAVIGPAPNCCKYPDPCQEPLWLAIPQFHKDIYCKRCKVHPYNGSWPVWLLNASFNPPPYWTDSFPSGTPYQEDYCDCCPPIPVPEKNCTCCKVGEPLGQSPVTSIPITDSCSQFNGQSGWYDCQDSNVFDPKKCKQTIPPDHEHEIDIIQERFKKLANIIKRK